MKNIVFILFMMTSCNFLKVAKLVDNQKITFKKKQMHFEMVNNRILIKDSVNFFLDIGAPNVIFDNYIKTFHPIDSISVGNMETVTGTKIENKMFLFEIENPVFKIDKAIFRKFSLNNVCLKTISKGLVGSELFYDKIIKLDFDEQRLDILDLQTPIPRQYTEVIVKDFDGYYFIVEFEIGMSKIQAKLDTGNPHSFVLKDFDFNRLSDGKVDKSYIFSKNKIDSISLRELNIGIAGNKYGSHIIFNKSTIKRNLVGVEFMKHFNWILDYKNGKVYISNLQKTYEKISTTKFVILDERLIMSETADKKNLDNLGKEVLTVNGKRVLPENLCEMQKLLNHYKRWEALKVIFKNGNYYNE